MVVGELARQTASLLVVSALATGAGTGTGTATAVQDWVQIETPHFFLLTNADPRTGRNVALEFEQARAVFLSALSTDVETALPIVIFAVKDRRDLSELLPGIRGELPVGAFLSSPDRHRIAVRLDEPSEHRFQTVYHEYHHLLFRSSVARAPIWLVEGLAEFWSHMRMGNDGVVTIGQPSPRHLRALRLGSMMPLGRLLRYEGNVHDEPVERIAVLYAQSWALVHYLMLGDTSTGRPRVERYIALVDGGVDAVEGFETVFGSVATVEVHLRDYLDRTMYPALRLDAPDPPPASEFRYPPLTEADALAARGTFVATGPWPHEALPHLERALAIDPESRAAMEGMGFLRFREGDLDEAERWFEKVAHADATSYLAHYYLGILEKRRLGASPTIEVRLERALELNPTFAPALVALSAHIAEDEERLDEALALAEKATHLTPDVAEAWANLAAVLTRMDRPDEAREAMNRARATEAK